MRRRSRRGLANTWSRHSSCPDGKRLGQTHDCGSKRTDAMDMVDFRYLSVAVETGSFSRAAQSLGIKPSTISRRITRLEDELAVTIFERGPFAIRLTPPRPDHMVH